MFSLYSPFRSFWTETSIKQYRKYAHFRAYIAFCFVSICNHKWKSNKYKWLLMFLNYPVMIVSWNMLPYKYKFHSNRLIPWRNIGILHINTNKNHIFLSSSSAHYDLYKSCDFFFTNSSSAIYYLPNTFLSKTFAQGSFKSRCCLNNKLHFRSKCNLFLYYII